MLVTYAQAVGDAIKEEMRNDENVIVYGEDVAQMGNIFGITKGLLEEFGHDRVKNTPIAETAIVGSAIGAAVTGLRPCVELMYSDFTMVAFSELFHCVGKWRYMHGPEYKLPLVVRSAMGSSFGAGAEHSNCVESLFMHATGLTIVSPSTAYDAKGLLKSAIRSDDPVLFFEHKQLYKTKEEIPDEEYTIPLGVADVKRQGTDVTVIAVGLMVSKALEAA
jgi:pyruvate dehydrogenase E1 component beta subunit